MTGSTVILKFVYSFVFQLGLGIIVLLVSTRILVGLAVKISASVRISPFIVGVTVVALGTSLPELAVSAAALARQDVGLALGNIVGSNIVNIFLVFPVGILIGKLRIGTTKTQYNAFLLLAITALFIALRMTSIPSLVLGAFFIFLALLVTVVEYKWAMFGRTHEDLLKLKKLKKERLSLGQILGFLISIGGIIVGGILVVASVENISLLTGYSTTILGLTITAVATSLPELLTTVFSQEENQEKITLGNIVGSNIYNLLFIGGVVTLFSTNTPVQTRDWVTLVFATMCFVAILTHFKGRKVPRWVGFLLIVFLAIYLYLLGRSK